MYIHVDNPVAHDFKVIDLDTGKELDRCKWANDKTGEYCEFQEFTKHNAIYKTKRANIKIVYHPIKE